MTRLAPSLTLLLLAAATPLSAEPLKLDAGKTTTLACKTKAVVVADSGAKATSGQIALSVTLDDKGEAGRWSPAAVDAAHGGSLALALRETCKDGCPVAAKPAGETQLWAPAPKGLDALGDAELLTIAVLKADGALRASTFRGKQIEALEEGTCVPPHNAPGAAAGPPATEK